MVLSGQDNRLENLYKYSIKVSCNAGIALCKGIWINLLFIMCLISDT